ncbi:MAG: cytochrome c oxidase assembly protein [Alphaproteobacteria bacterium]|uniref:cytochrome c oxidase assembly protein n=1 Tax=Marinobacter salarius TaxID=1420917 RepID=UPI0032EEA560
MASSRTQNLRVLALVGTLLAVMSGLVVYAPTLYQVFCNLTGYGGTVQRAAAPEAAPAAALRSVTVSFDANVAPGLPWEFWPEQRNVEIRFDEPTRVNYYARNNSDETVVARAIFNVTPYKAAPYFFKIECFCFTEEKLGPGETAMMPLVLYVDEQLLADSNTQDVSDITLSYTFFRQTNLSPEEVEGARDLKVGSQEIDARLNRSETVGFDNDAPRR